NLAHTTRDNKTKLHFSAQYGIDRNRLPSTDIYSSALTLAPNAPAIFDEFGELNWENSTWNNPLAPLKSTYSNKARNLLVNSGLSYMISENIEFKTNFGYSRSDINELRLNPHTMNNPSWGLTSENSTSSHNTGLRDSWVIEPQLNANY